MQNLRDQGEERLKKRLQPTKQSRAVKTMYGFDIETYSDKNHFLCASVYNDDYVSVHYNKKDMINLFKKDLFKNAIVSATNLAFDFFGLFNRTEEIMQFFTLFRGSELICAKTSIKKKEFLKTDPTSKGKITFLDTGNYARISVKNIGKIVNLKKLEHPDCLGKLPSTAEWNELIDYNIRDSEISCKFMSFLYQGFIDLGATPKMTIASTSMSLFKNRYLKDVYWRHETEDIKEIFNAYYGGRTEAFKRGTIKDVNYYDINSLYPYEMKKRYPNPNTIRKTYQNTLFYIETFEGVSDVEIYCPFMKIPLLPVRHDGKLIFPTGSFRGWYSHLELREAMKLGYVITRTHKTFYFKETCRPFKDYVDDLYNLRRKYQKEESAMQMVVKLCMNSLYGKFGQKFEDRDNWIPFNYNKKELNKLKDIDRIGEFIRVKETTEPSSFCIPIWAVYVTAYARIELYNLLKDNDPIYCDTDSIITKKELPTSTVLGKLKKEKEIDYGIIVKPKMYAMKDRFNDEDVKIKGLGTSLTILEFENLLENPKAVYKKFIKFKESVIRKMLPNEIIEMTKHFDLEDSKRVWKNKFNPNNLETSVPIELKNNKIINKVERSCHSIGKCHKEGILSLYP